jgi:4-amino-4-deoxy-L-arabinose transferase-like glycosyltransferase
MATAFYMMLTLLVAGLTARELLGKERSEITMLILLGCTGLQISAHKLITDVSLLSGFSLALYGLALCRRRPALGGVWIGMGTGIGFMSKGLLAPALIGITALVMPVLFAEWRNRRYFFSLFIALAVALPWHVIWPYALFHRSPDLFKEWFWLQNIGRFFGSSRWGEREVPGFYFFTLPWFALPALPLALWTLWHNRRSWRGQPALQLPLTAFLVMLTVLSLSSSARSIYTLPMLLPLTLLAAAGADSLPDKVKNAFNRFGVAFFGMFFMLLWLGWIVMVTGHPEFAASKLNYLQPDSARSFNVLLVVVACAYTVAWLMAVTRSARSPYHPVINWTTGIIVTWGLLMTLWLPWLDARSGYHSLFTSLKEAMPEHYHIIARQGVGESERAMLEYYAGIFTRQVQVDNNLRDADLLLIQTGGMPIDPPAGLRWRLLWEGKRLSELGKVDEIFRLYQRVDR